jgi:hypothetical protein
MLLFFMPFEVDIDKHTLNPYMASVNHNFINETITILLNEITWLNIVHTLMDFFCHKSDGKTTQRRWKTWIMMLVL